MPKPGYLDHGDFNIEAGLIRRTENPRYTYAGFAIYRPELFADCVAGRFSVVPLMFAAADAGRLSGSVYEGRWADIGTPERLAALQETAQRADVVMLPGAGFDVVPSDCLAASLVEALPAATRLELAIYLSGVVSPGTAKTALAILDGVSPSEIPIVANRKWDLWVNDRLLVASGVELPRGLRRKAKSMD